MNPGAGRLDLADVTVDDGPSRWADACGEPLIVKGIVTFVVPKGIEAGSHHDNSDGVAPASDGTSYTKKFSGKRAHRIIKGVGHNLPQETPRAFAEAIVDVDGY